METLVGMNLGGYTLTRILGSGGMGTVYLAEDQTVGQQVAIKVVHTSNDEAYNEMLSTSQAADRFRQEARAVASLDHLHILPLYRYGEEETDYGTQAYMVMQYRPEGSLQDWQKKRAHKALNEASVTSALQESIQLPSGLPTDWPMNIEEAAEYLRQAASALQYAHDSGIIHRDVKPANFLLRFDTNPSTDKHSAFLLLSDFGLAKFFSSSSATTNILGTPTYMAPEQFNGNAEPASDQYALAIMIYYLLAGRPPFVGDPMHLLRQHLNTAPPPIRTFAPMLSAGIEQVLARALTKRPSERYPSISAFAENFIQHMYKDQCDILYTASAQSIYLSQPNFKSTVEVSLQHVLTEQSAIPQTPQLTLEDKTASAFSQRDSVLPTPLQKAFSPGPSSSPLSPAQGQQTISAYTLPPRSENLSGRMPGTQSMDHRTSRRGALGWILGGIAVLGLGIGADLGIYLYEKHLFSNQQQTPSVALTSSLTSPSPVTSPSPTASSSPTAPNQQNIPSGIQHILRGHSGKVTSLSWSPDGSQLASASLDHSVRLWNLSTQQNTTTYLKHTQGILTVAWSHHHNLLASGGQDKTILVWNTAGNTKHKFANQAGPVEQIIWSLNDQNIIVDIPNHRVQEITLSQGTVIAGGRIFGNYSLALSPNGRYLAIGAQGSNIFIYNTTNLSQLVIEPIPLGRLHPLAWSPDSTLLASEDANNNVRVIDITTKTSVYTLPLGEIVNDLSWEPSYYTGRLAIASNTGTVIVWNTHTGQHTSYRGHQGPVTAVAWGKQALASGSTDKTIIIWTV